MHHLDTRTFWKNWLHKAVMYKNSSLYSCKKNYASDMHPKSIRFVQWWLIINIYPFCKVEILWEGWSDIWLWCEAGDISIEEMFWEEMISVHLIFLMGWTRASCGYCQVYFRNFSTLGILNHSQKWGRNGCHKLLNSSLHFIKYSGKLVDICWIIDDRYSLITAVAGKEETIVVYWQTWMDRRKTEGNRLLTHE